VSSPPLSLSLFLSLFSSPSSYFFPARPLFPPARAPRRDLGPLAARPCSPQRRGPCSPQGAPLLPAARPRPPPAARPLLPRSAPPPSPAACPLAPRRRGPRPPPSARPSPPDTALASPARGLGTGVQPLRRQRGPSRLAYAQPQRARQSNFSLISFEFSLMNVLRRTPRRATNEFKFRFINVVHHTLRRATSWINFGYLACCVVRFVARRSILFHTLLICCRVLLDCI
jgi:hypothetical protein